MTDLDGDAKFMREALREALAAADDGDVPVGAVITIGERIVGRGRNRRVLNGAPLAHAEIEALREAATTLGNWRFDGATMFVTLEPCAMCAGALVQTRLARVVFGARDERGGGVRSLFQICDDRRTNHRVEVAEGLLADECAAVLKKFFADRR